jgi:hypothetical protein
MKAPTNSKKVKPLQFSKVTKSSAKPKVKFTVPKGAIKITALDGAPLGYIIAVPDDDFKFIFEVYVFEADGRAIKKGISTKFDLATGRVVNDYNKIHNTRVFKTPVVKPDFLNSLTL